MEKLDRSGENIARGSEVNPWRKMAGEVPSFEEKMASEQRKEAEVAFDSERQGAEKVGISGKDVVDFAASKIEELIAHDEKMLEKGGLDEKYRAVVERAVNDNKHRLELWDEAYSMMDDSMSVPDALAIVKDKYERHGKLIRGEHGRQCQEKARLIEGMSGSGFGVGYEFWVQRMAEEKRNEADKELAKEQQQAELEKLLRKSVNIEALMSDNDEQLARQARLIDNSTFAIPGQEEAADRRLERAKKDYKRMKEFRDAERTVLEDIQDYDKSSYSQEDLVERLRDYQLDVTMARDEGWVQLSQACSRLEKRLEKFVPDLAGDLSNEDLDYWNKITGSAKPIAPEALVPKTLSKDELAELVGGEVVNDKLSPQVDMQESEKSQEEEKQPASYQVDGGSVNGEAIITVGQEIPESWLEAKKISDMSENGFGIKWGITPKVDDFLDEALKIEFSRLSEDERSRYDYASVAKMIKEEARRTKRIPDIAAIIKMNRK